MTEPTTKPVNPKQAAGAKATPHTTHTGQGKEGGALQSRPEHEPEHTENLPAQEPKHNSNNDRGEPENRDGAQSQESRTPPGRNSRGGSVDEDGDASEAYFNRTLWMSQVFSGSETLDSSAVLVLLALGHLFDDRGECWPTQNHLASMTKLGLRTVIRRLEELEASGWISTDRNLKIEGKRRAILYKALR